MNNLNIEYQEVAKLTPYARNSRTHSDEQVSQIAASIKEFGWTNPILIDEKDGIIAGHGRLMAAQRLNEANVPTIRLSGLTEAQKKAYVIADNKLALNAGWDEEMLAVEVEELLGEGYDLSLTGFSEKELNDILSANGTDYEGLTDEDEVPQPPEEPNAKLGDIYQLGEHRLMCGDSINEKNLKNLLSNKKADLVFTDPPYNADYKSQGKNVLLRKGIKNDNMSNDDFQIFAENIFKAIKENTYKGSSMYICCNWKDSYPRFYFIAEKNNINVSNCIVWNKESAGMGWNDYRYQFEFILYGFEKTKKHNFYGDRKNTDMWSLKRDNRNTYEHPTQKPVELIERAIINSSLQEQTVLDLFLGSGSTLIACEKTKRKCYGIELDPTYVDVIIQRWENFTGKKAKKIC